MSRGGEQRGMATGLLTEAGGVLLAWMFVLAAENVGVGLGYRALFAGSWEMALARTNLTPLLLGALVPAAFVAAATGRVVARAESSVRARRAVALLAGAAGAALGYGVSFGRHLASWAMRAPFILVVALAAAGVAAMGAPRVARAARARPHVLAGLGLAVAAAAWWADGHVLPRLYPAFHAALFVLVLGCGAALALVFRGGPLGRYASWAALALGVASAAWAKRAASGVRSADNLRLVLVEHAPLLGRAVGLATWLSPPPSDDPAGASDLALAVGPARAFDWTGRDVLVVSIDALRADHVGAYCYPRATTPHLDALARQGARFDAAYCPTPHTSYSVTSMMTGKYMRPLLTLGVGEDSETWASYARRYGYRTAAFYPPAVFFIDGPRFARFEERGFDFEYRKVEFASPALRVDQVREYLRAVPRETPVFLWVHLFEPHEPYVAHPAHPFGTTGAETDVDLYDGEIAAADEGLGAIVVAFRAARGAAKDEDKDKRGDPVIIVTADHGEEFGDHGGRYHGTTVYEEQVRVPLVVVAPGVLPRTVDAPVQTIDLLPTVLSAMGVPRPPRLRGTDLGPLLAGKPAASVPLAFAETDDYTLFARGAERLICVRKAAACALYDVQKDPHETRDLSTERADDARELRRATSSLVRDAARYEAGPGAELPEALRRGMMGDVDVAPDVASLLDDVKPDIRRRAAEVLFRLHAKDTAPALARALAKDEDATVQRFAALALVRVGEAPGPLADALVTDAARAWRRSAALAFAERGDARGEGELVRWWAAEGPPANVLGFDDARALLAAIAKVRAKDGGPALARSLSDVRLRIDIADALGDLGDPRAKGPLLAAFAEEPYLSARPHEALALVKLGARAELYAPLARFAGAPWPMREAVAIAASAGLLTREHGGWVPTAPTTFVDLVLPLPPLRADGSGNALVLVLGGEGSAPRGTFGGTELRFTTDGPQSFANLHATAGKVILHIDDATGLRGVWVVAPAAGVLGPAPAASDGGIDEPR